MGTVLPRMSDERKESEADISSHLPETGESELTSDKGNSADKVCVSSVSTARLDSPIIKVC